MTAKISSPRVHHPARTRIQHTMTCVLPGIGGCINFTPYMVIALLGEWVSVAGPRLHVCILPCTCGCINYTPYMVIALLGP